MAPSGDEVHLHWSEWLFRRLREAGVDDPAVDMWAAIYDHDTDALERAMQQGADPNETDASVIGRHSQLLRERFPYELAQFERAGIATPPLLVAAMNLP